jgi:hypothetical protein
MRFLRKRGPNPNPERERIEALANDAPVSSDYVSCRIDNTLLEISGGVYVQSGAFETYFCPLSSVKMLSHGTRPSFLKMMVAQRKTYALMLAMWLLLIISQIFIFFSTGNEFHPIQWITLLAMPAVGLLMLPLVGGGFSRKANTTLQLDGPMGSFTPKFNHMPGRDVTVDAFFEAMSRRIEHAPVSNTRKITAWLPIQKPTKLKWLQHVANLAASAAFLGSFVTKLLSDSGPPAPTDYGSGVLGSLLGFLGVYAIYYEHIQKPSQERKIAKAMHGRQFVEAEQLVSQMGPAALKNPNVLGWLVVLSLLKRDFESAAFYREQLDRLKIKINKWRIHYTPDDLREIGRLWIVPVE